MKQLQSDFGNAALIACRPKSSFISRFARGLTQPGPSLRLDRFLILGLKGFQRWIARRKGALAPTLSEGVSASRSDNYFVGCCVQASERAG